MPIRKIDKRGVHHYYPEFESMSRETLKKDQWQRLRRQLQHMWENNLFFRKRFETQGITPDDIKSPEDYAKKVPLMEKKDLIADQTDHPPYGERLGVPLSKVVQTHITSGTSGLGQEVYGCTQADVDHIGSLWALHYYWAGLRTGDGRPNATGCQVFFDSLL
jgi:phenylacetate-CoA ligase